MELKINYKEIRALKALLYANPCSSGCVYPEMEYSKKDCIDCEFIKSKCSISDKLELKMED